ncbi:adenylate kinase [bacterium]|nr:adenylate kinase [bacterium]
MRVFPREGSVRDICNMTFEICKKHLIFLGPPGCGKGTQSENFSEELGYKHYSTGDILRESVRSGNELGKKVQVIIENGDLVSDETMKEIILEKFNSISKDTKFILDGYPRTLKQAEDLKRISEESEIHIDSVIYFDVPFDSIIERISSRRVCPDCAKVYNLLTLPPHKDNLCDECNVQLVQREDDKEDAVKHRLNVYKENTAPLISFYQSEKKLTKINGNGRIQNVFNLLKQELLCL